jgi:hypothetical protein
LFDFSAAGAKLTGDWALVAQPERTRAAAAHKKAEGRKNMKRIQELQTLGI